MSRASETLAIDGVLDALSRCLDAESASRVADFEFDADIQDRVSILATRANEGTLTAEERAEYEAIVNLDDFVSILQLKARRHLQANGSSG
jgi:hypothetical protein